MKAMGEYKYALIDEESDGGRSNHQQRSGYGSRIVQSLTFLLTLSVLGNIALCYRVQKLNAQRGHPPWSNSLDEIPWSPTKFKASLVADSEFVGPSPEVDALWDRYTTSPWIDGTSVVLSATEEEIRKSKWHNEELFPIETLVTLSPENGGGYMATIELPHQLHCLNVLRKYVYRDYYQDDHYFKTHDTGNHTAHCIEIIRQNIMCQSDTQLIPFHWVQDWPGPVPNFNTWHSCRNPDAVLQWAIDRAAPMVHIERKPAGVPELPGRP